MEEIKDKLKGSFLKKNILVYFIVFVVVILLLNWLIKSNQADRSKNQAENYNAYYKELLRQCGVKDKQLYDCCASSVELMAAGNYELAPELGCQFGFKLNTFSCQGSLKWCEINR